jgi:AcrR family transcriptional regulator
MARPRAADYDQRRAAIAETAARLFAERGYHGVAIPQIMQACGLTGGMLYHYFGSKEDLLHEVMAAHVCALEAAAQEVAAGGGAPADRLRRLTHAFLGLYAHAQAPQQVLLNDLDRLPPERRAEVVAGERRLIAAVQALIEALRPELKPRPAEARALTMLYFGLINWTHTWFDPTGPVSPDRLADMAVDLVLRGLGGVELGDMSCPPHKASTQRSAFEPSILPLIPADAGTQVLAKAQRVQRKKPGSPPSRG